MALFYELSSNTLFPATNCLIHSLHTNNTQPKQVHQTLHWRTNKVAYDGVVQVRAIKWTTESVTAAITTFTNQFECHKTSERDIGRMMLALSGKSGPNENLEGKESDECKDILQK